jgi:hypothetical protein
MRSLEHRPGIRDGQPRTAAEGMLSLFGHSLGHEQLRTDASDARSITSRACRIQNAGYGDASIAATD